MDQFLHIVRNVDSLIYEIKQHPEYKSVESMNENEVPKIFVAEKHQFDSQLKTNLRFLHVVASALHANNTSLDNLTFDPSSAAMSDSPRDYLDLIQYLNMARKVVMQHPMYFSCDPSDDPTVMQYLKTTSSNVLEFTRISLIARNIVFRRNASLFQQHDRQSDRQLNTNQNVVVQSNSNGQQNNFFISNDDAEAATLALLKEEEKADKLAYLEAERAVRLADEEAAASVRERESNRIGVVSDRNGNRNGDDRDDEDDSNEDSLDDDNTRTLPLRRSTTSVKSVKYLDSPRPKQGRNTSPPLFSLLQQSNVRQSNTSGSDRHSDVDSMSQLERSRIRARERLAQIARANQSRMPALASASPSASETVYTNVVNAPGGLNTHNTSNMHSNIDHVQNTDDFDDEELAARRLRTGGSTMAAKASLSRSRSQR
jgi:hypothetical protein